MAETPELRKMVVPETNQFFQEFVAKLKLRKSCEERAKTFSGQWQHDGCPDVKALAQAGFVYAGHGHSVSCVVCNVMIDKWRAGDSPVGLHFAHSPGCEFVSHLPERCFQRFTATGMKPKGGPSVQGNANWSIDGTEPESLADSEDIAELNKQMKDQYYCRLCHERESNVLLLPCSHVPVCSECVRERCCPACDQHIEATIRIYRS